MSNETSKTLASNPSLNKKHRVRFTIYYLNSNRKPEILFSGSEAAYRNYPTDFSHVHEVFQGTDAEFNKRCDELKVAGVKAVIRQENWDSSLRPKETSPYMCKRAGGDYAKPADVYEPDAESLFGVIPEFRKKKFDDVEISYK